ncbi:hypothetical protein Tco_0611260 [Tanacetum coccineum]
MIPMLWSPVIVAYDRNVELGISHQGSKRQLLYRSQISKLSSHEVKSTMKILSVVSITFDKKLGYGYLKEIVVGRADQKLYTFKEGDFSRLHLNDIKDMLLLVAQNKLFNLEGDVIVFFITALKMLTRSIIFTLEKDYEELGVVLLVMEYTDRQRTKTELALEQTQQGASYEVLVSIEGVEE